MTAAGPTNGAAGRLFRAKAPLRISFAGGGTDVPPFPAQEGGVVLSATIDRYAYGSLQPRADGQIRIESADFGLAVEYGSAQALTADGKLGLVKAAIRKLVADDERGFDVFLRSTAPPGSGLGSSSTMVVTLIGLLMEYLRLPLTDYEIAEMAYTIERVDLGISGGLQDQYAASFGGFNFIEFHGDRVIVNPLRISRDVVHELEHNLLLAYTGRTRASDRIIDDQTSRFTAGREDTVAALRTQKELAIEMKNALLRGRLNAFGELLGTAWEHKKRMSPRISTDFIDEAYATAVGHGALGGKVTGAGGGGYMLFYCPFHRRHRIAEALTELGTTVTDFAFDHHGLETWSVEA